MNIQKFCYICKKEKEDKYVKDKKYRKGRDNCHYTEECKSAAHSICSLRYIVPNKFQ